MTDQINSQSHAKSTATILPQPRARRAALCAALGLLVALAVLTQSAPAAVTEAWVRRYNSPGNFDDIPAAVAMDRSGNVVVSGGSGTLKYAASDGTLLWEHRYNGPAKGENYPSALAVDGSGNVVVTGYSYNGTNYDFYTAKYAAADGALLWEERFNAATDLSFLLSHVLALGPDGAVAVTGYSHGITGFDYATVVYREPDARAPKENVLAELIALRATVTERNDRRRLDEAMRHLTNSLAAKFWVDETHLERRRGALVFHEDRLTVWNLCRLIKSRTSQIPDAIPQGFIDRIFQADRLLADDAIGDAITAGVSSSRIKQAQKFLSRGDAAARDGNCFNGMAAYSNAWKLAVRAKVFSATHASIPPGTVP